MYSCRGEAFGAKLTEVSEDLQPNASPLPIHDRTVQQLSNSIAMGNYFTANHLAIE